MAVRRTDGTDNGAAPSATLASHGRGVVSVLGACTVLAPDGDGVRRVPLTATQQRLVALLADVAPWPLERDALVRGVWGEAAPRTVRAALNNQISRIRQLCGADVVLTLGDAYALGWPTDLEDAATAVRRAEQALAAGDAARAERVADDVLARFRDAADADGLQVPAAAEALRRAAELLRLRAAVANGRLGWAAFEAERLVTRHPLDEACWALLAEVHERSGRRGEALGVIDRARRMLRARLGLELGHQLEAVLASILQIDPAPSSRADVAGVPPERPASTLVGRRRELDAIDTALATAGFVVLRGEAGSGRSSVLGEVVRRARRAGRRVGAAACALHPAVPLAELDALLDDLGLQVDPTFGLLNGFVGALETIGERPVLLVIDDLDRAGPSTVQTLRDAAASGHAHVVASSGLSADAFVADAAVEMAPLDAEAVVQLAELVTGTTVPPEAGARLAALSGGNPALLEQLLHESGELDEIAGLDAASTPGAGDDHGAVPPRAAGVARLVRRRLEGLGARTMRVLEVVAVCGGTVPLDVLERLIPATGGLDTARALGLLDAMDGSVGFRHAAVQRVVVSDLSPGRRVELHHLAGRAFVASGAPPAAAAHHLLEAAQLDPAGAVSMAREAARQSSRRGAHREAAAWLGRAQQCIDQHGPVAPGIVIEVMIARGDALRLSGSPDHVELLFEAAERARMLDDPDLLTDAVFALLQLGSTSETGPIDPRVAALVATAIERADDSERQARVAAAASLAYSMTGEPQRCRQLFDDAARLARRSSTRREVLPFAYLSLGHPRDVPDRARIAAELRALADEADDPTAMFEALQLEFSVALQSADGPAARVALDGMEAIVDRVGDVGRRWALLYCTAAIAHLDDRLQVSESIAEAAMGVFAPVAPSRAMAAYGGQLIALRYAQGRLGEWAGVFENLVTEQPGVPAWHAPLALSLVHIDPVRAEWHAGRALDEVADDFLWLATHVIGGRAAAVAGTRATQERYREVLEPWDQVACWQGTCSYGPVAIPLAMLAAALGDHRAAARHRDTAVDVARRLGAPVFEREVGLLSRR